MPTIILPFTIRFGIDVTFAAMERTQGSELTHRLFDQTGFDRNESSARDRCLYFLFTESKCDCADSTKQIGLLQEFTVSTGYVVIDMMLT